MYRAIYTAGRFLRQILKEGQGTSCRIPYSRREPVKLSGDTFNERGKLLTKSRLATLYEVGIYSGLTVGKSEMSLVVLF